MKLLLFLLGSAQALAVGQPAPERASSVSITVQVLASVDFSRVKNYAAALYDAHGERIDSLVAVDTNAVVFRSVPVTGVTASARPPSGYSLGQNYPNPFNPSSRIQFSIAQAGPVSIKTYTILGQEDASLELTLAPGRYEVRYEPGGAAGVIFYRLTTPNFTETRKMLQFGGDKGGVSRLSLIHTLLNPQQVMSFAEAHDNVFVVKVYNLPSTFLPISDTSISITHVTGDTTVTITAEISPDVTPPDLVLNEAFTIPPDKYYAYSWIEILNPTRRQIPLFERRFPASGFCVGAEGTILFTENDGEAWTAQTTASAASLTSIAIPYHDTAFAAGSEGTMLRMTGDETGALTVEPLPAPTSEDLNDIEFIPLSPVGCAVGTNGTIFMTTTGGRTWTAAKSGTAQTLNALSFAAGGTAYACGDSGVVLKSEPGQPWGSVDPGSGYREVNFHAIAFVADTGLLVGDRGFILRTDNGGQTWTSEASGFFGALRGVFFSPEENGFVHGAAWVVGDSGQVFRSEGGVGATWTRQTSTVAVTLKSVTFVDSVRGWAFGDNGTVLHTSNGGREWVQQGTGTTRTLAGGSFLPLLVQVTNSYSLEMRVRRKRLYYDENLPVDFITNPNPDYVTAVDSALVSYSAEWEYLFHGDKAPLPPQGFAVVANDSARFYSHSPPGPGATTVFTFPYLLEYDTTGGKPARYKAFYRWDLLAGGEIRLLKSYQKEIRSNPPSILASQQTLLDLVRYGGYRELPDIAPQNEPLSEIPEFWSIARFSNILYVRPATESTSRDFYPEANPIPGWYSSRRR